MVKRGAFTLLEVILAIVIVGISFVAVPTILQNVNRSLESSIIEEAIFALSTKMQQVLSHQWDENALSQDSKDGTSYAKIVDVSHGDSELNRTNASSSFRVGHIQEPLRRKFHSPSKSGSTTFNDGESAADYDDIDDFVASNLPLFDGFIASLKGYKSNYTIDIDVSYVSDSANYSTQTLNFNFSTTPSSNPTNLKMVQIKAKKGSSDVVVLRAYVANIGEIDYYKRRF